MPSRIACRAISGLAALPTRKQYFKEQVVKLRQADPDRWTAHALARHFGVPIENMQAMLALQAVEVERAGSSELDPELVELAEDAEEYLESEYAETLAPQTNNLAKATGATESFFDGDAPDVPGITLDKMSLEQEHTLVAAVAQRFGGAARPGVGRGEAMGTAVSTAIRGLSVGEMRHLAEQLGIRPHGQPAAGDESEEARQTLKHAMLSALTSGLPKSLLAAATTDSTTHLARLDLLDLPSLPPRAAGIARGGGGRRASPNEEPAEFWIDSGREAALEAAGGASQPSVRPVEDDVIARTRAWLGQATTPVERHIPRRDLADDIASNLETRARRLAPGAQHFPYRKTGRVLITEIDRPHHKSVPMATKIWVSDKGAGVREATEGEARKATWRVQPPMLKPRIKRNY